MSDEIKHLIIEMRDRNEKLQAFFLRRIASDNASIAAMLAYLVKPVRITNVCEAIPRIGAINQGTRVEYLPGGPQSLPDSVVIDARHCIVTFRFRKPPHLAIYSQYMIEHEDRPEPDFYGELEHFIRIPTELLRTTTATERRNRPSYRRQLERQRARRALARKVSKPATMPRGRVKDHGPPPMNLPRQPESFEARALAKLLKEESPRTLRNALVKKHR